MFCRPRLIVALFTLAGLAGLFYCPVERHVAAVKLLQAMASEDRSRVPESGPLVEEISLPDGTPLRARVYGPSPENARRSVVLVHGIHHRGMDEPRLIRFAHHLAEVGCRVLTPEISELADYQITSDGILKIRASVEYMARADAQIGLIGFSFGGGLSLLAATTPRTAEQLKYVASVGGYHDLHRSLRFLATHKVEGPSGVKKRRAHEYGLLVLVYGHLQSFGLEEDSAPFRAALRSWLMEDRSAARRHAQSFKSKKAQRLFHLIETERLSEISGQLLELLSAREEPLRMLSPRGRLKDIHTEVLFLHGTSDSVIPPEETLFAEAELSRAKHPDFRTLITPLLEHVRVENPANSSERLALIRLISRLL